MSTSIPVVDAYSVPEEICSEGSSVAPPWRRAIAYELDALALSIAASAIGTNLFFERISNLNWWALLIGFFVTLAYFATFDSRLGNGQTIGKRLLKLKVVDAQGNCISLSKAAVRSAVFAIPCLLFGIRFPETRMPWIVSLTIGVVIYGIGGATLYLITFNKWTRQGIHDLATGTFVVNAENKRPLEPFPIPYLHWLILGASLVAAVGGAIAMHLYSPDYDTTPERRQDSWLVEQMDGVLRCHVTDYLSHTGGKPEKTLYVPVVLAKEPPNHEAYANAVAKTILQHDPLARDYDEITVRLDRSYNTGISQGQKSSQYIHTPAQWSARVFAPSPNPMSNPGGK